MKMMFLLCLGLVANIQALRVHKFRFSKGEPANLKADIDGPTSLKAGVALTVNELSTLVYSVRDLDMQQGEAEALTQMMLKAGITHSDVGEIKANWGNAQELTGRQMTLWMLAAREERNRVGGHKLKNMTQFGKFVPKIPRSWVDMVSALGTTPKDKTSKFMFSGSVIHPDVMPNRKWLVPFVKANFARKDYYKATDAKIMGKGYKPLGAYDTSLDKDKGYRPKDFGVDNVKFDASYWKAMAHSEFVLCPGGDRPYSYRFYETFATKAVPLINEFETDWNLRNLHTQRIQKVDYEIMMANGTLVYDPAVAERNYRKFIKYQTFMEGDNEPTQM